MRIGAMKMAVVDAYFVFGVDFFVRKGFGNRSRTEL